jgi:hypothetical protein
MPDGTDDHRQAAADRLVTLHGGFVNARRVEQMDDIARLGNLAHPGRDRALDA